MGLNHSNSIWKLNYTNSYPPGSARLGNKEKLGNGDMEVYLTLVNDLAITYLVYILYVGLEVEESKDQENGMALLLG